MHDDIYMIWMKYYEVDPNINGEYVDRYPMAKWDKPISLAWMILRAVGVKPLVKLYE